MGDVGRGRKRPPLCWLSSLFPPGCLLNKDGHFVHWIGYVLHISKRVCKKKKNRKKQKVVLSGIQGREIGIVRSRNRSEVPRSHSKKGKRVSFITLITLARLPLRNTHTHFQTWSGAENHTPGFWVIEPERCFDGGCVLGGGVLLLVG